MHHFSKVEFEGLSHFGKNLTLLDLIVEISENLTKFYIYFVFDIDVIILFFNDYKLVLQNPEITELKKITNSYSSICFS